MIGDTLLNTDRKDPPPHAIPHTVTAQGNPHTQDDGGKAMMDMDDNLDDPFGFALSDIPSIPSFLPNANPSPYTISLPSITPNFQLPPFNSFHQGIPGGITGPVDFRNNGMLDKTSLNNLASLGGPPPTNNNGDTLVPDQFFNPANRIGNLTSPPEYTFPSSHTLRPGQFTFVHTIFNMPNGMPNMPNNTIPGLPTSISNLANMQLPPSNAFPPTPYLQQGFAFPPTGTATPLPPLQLKEDNEKAGKNKKKEEELGALMNPEGGISVVEKMTALHKAMQQEDSVTFRGLQLAVLRSKHTTKQCLRTFVLNGGLATLNGWLSEKRPLKPKVRKFILQVLATLEVLPVSLDLLKQSSIGKTVRGLKSLSDTEITEKAQSIIADWMKFIEESGGAAPASIGHAKAKAQGEKDPAQPKRARTGSDLGKASTELKGSGEVKEGTLKTSGEGLRGSNEGVSGDGRPTKKAKTGTTTSPAKDKTAKPKAADSKKAAAVPPIPVAPKPAPPAPKPAAPVAPVAAGAVDDLMSQLNASAKSKPAAKKKVLF